MAYRIHLIYLSLLCLIATSCGNRNASFPIPEKVVDVALLTTARGITSFSGQRFSGKAFALDIDGDTSLLEMYSEGKLHGANKAWYSDGKMMHHRWYQNGKKENLHQGWWPTGQLKFQYEFKEDEYERAVKEWYESGVMFKHFTYKSGHEVGPQKMWRLDGSIYANYVVKNNRIYGLSGRKNCRNLSKM